VYDIAAEWRPGGAFAGAVASESGRYALACDDGGARGWLDAIDAHGLRGAVERACGGFAVVVWDAAEDALYLVRDRVGIKPLFYAETKDSLLFASQLETLASHPSFDKTPDTHAARELERLGYVPGPATIYARASKLTPATILRVSTEGFRRDVYWHAAEVAQRVANTFEGSDEDARAAIRALLPKVERQGNIVSDLTAERPDDDYPLRDLRDRILAGHDRMARRLGIDIDYPLLDHRYLELAWSFSRMRPR
jgi:hypothetical protein